MSSRTITVMLTPVDNEIQFAISERIYCSRSNDFLRTNGSYECNDCIWSGVFGSKEKAADFVAKGATIIMKMPMGNLGYDPCDFIC